MRRWKVGEMLHSGRVWLEDDGESSATEGEVTIDPEHLSLTVSGQSVGQWPAAAVRITEETPGFLISAGGEAFHFVPEDTDGFLGDSAAIRFRSRMGQRAETTPQPSPPPPPFPATAAPPPPPPAPQVGTYVGQPVAKNAGLAAVLSAIWSGLGQIYNGEIGKGVLLMFVQIVNFVLAFILIGIFTGFAVWVWGMIDAYQTAEKHNRAHGFAI